MKATGKSEEKGMKYIWIISDDDSNEIAAPTWEAVIHGWIDKWHVTGDSTPVFDESRNEWRLLQDMYGDEWQSVLIAFDDKDFNDLFDAQFFVYQVPYYEK